MGSLAHTTGGKSVDEIDERDRHVVATLKIAARDSDGHLEAPDAEKSCL